MSIPVEREELLRLRKYAEFRDGIDAIALIDQILARDNAKTAEVLWEDQNPATRGRRFT